MGHASCIQVMRSYMHLSSDVWRRGDRRSPATAPHTGRLVGRIRRVGAHRATAGRPYRR